MSETRFITVPVGVFQVSFLTVNYLEFTQWTRMVPSIIQRLGAWDAFRQYTLKTLFEEILQVKIPKLVLKEVINESCNPSVPLLELTSGTSELRIQDWETIPIKRYKLTDNGRELLVNGNVRGNPEEETAVIEYDFVRQEAKLLNRNGKEHQKGTYRDENLKPNPVLQDWCQGVFPRIPFQKILEQDSDCVAVEKVTQTPSSSVRIKGKRIEYSLGQQRGRSFIRFKDPKIEEQLNHLFDKSQLENMIRKEIAQ